MNNKEGAWLGRDMVVTVPIYILFTLSYILFSLAVE